MYLQLLCVWGQVRSGAALKEDVQVLLKFWSLMLSDRKYIKHQVLGGEKIQLPYVPSKISICCGTVPEPIDC